MKRAALARYRQLPAAERRATLRAGILLPAFSVAIRIRALEQLIPLVGLHQVNLAESQATDPTAASVDPGREYAEQVSRAVSRVAGRTPWTSTCLAQALAGARLLHDAGLVATITLGVAKPDESTKTSDALLAHAWLDSNGVSVTGGTEATTYTPVGRFS